MRWMLVLVLACGSSKPTTSSPPPPTTATPTEQADPCAEHKDAASCKADANCGGAAYKGESVAACQYDARGFTTNCPWVGCIALAKH
jgi:hypothetical protein